MVVMMKKYIKQLTNRLDKELNILCNKLYFSNLLLFHNIYTIVFITISIAFSAVYISCFIYSFFIGNASPASEIFHIFPGLAENLNKKVIVYSLILYAVVGYIIEFLINRTNRIVTWPIQRGLLLFISFITVISIFLSILGYYQFNPQGLASWNFYSIGGIVPFSDAAGHIMHSVNFFRTGVLHDWVLRRPLSALLTSGITGLGGAILSYVIVIRCLFAATACWIFAFSVARSFGIWSAIVAVIFSINFVAPHLPSFMSEGLGFIWGCLAISLWLEGIRKSSIGILLYAFALTCIGLLTRMGSMFLIPLFAIFILFYWYKYKSEYGRKLKIIIYICTIFIVICTINIGIIKMSSNSQNLGSNFSWTICGLSLGTNWSAPREIYKDELSKLKNEKEQSYFLYEKAYQNIIENPYVLLARLWDAEKDFYKNFYMLLPPLKLVYILCFLLVLKLFLISPSQRVFWIIFWFAIFLSVPFIQFDGGDRINIFAYPFMAAFFSISLAKYRFENSTLFSNIKFTPAILCIIFSSSLLLLMTWTFFWPNIIPFSPFRELRQFSAQKENINGEYYVIGKGINAGILVIPDSYPKIRSVNSIKISEFKKMLVDSKVLRHENLPKTIEDNNIEAPFAIMCMPKIPDDSNMYLIAPPEILLNNDILIWKVATYPIINDKFDTWHFVHSYEGIK